MTPPLEERATLYVLDQLEPSARATFETRLTRDPELLALVRSLESTLEERIRSLPQHPPPVGLLTRIEAQLDLLSSERSGRERARASSVSPRDLFTRWVLPAAAAVALGAATFFYLDRQRPSAPSVVLVVGLDPQRSVVTELPLRNAPDGADARFVQLAALAERFWTRPGDLPAASRATADQPAYALFDPATRQGFIAVRQLPSQPPGKRYHLWLVDTETGRTIDAGSLPTSTSGRLYFFSLDSGTVPAGAPLSFLITAEDASSPAASHPRGEPVLGQNPI